MRLKHVLLPLLCCAGCMNADDAKRQLADFTPSGNARELPEPDLAALPAGRQRAPVDASPGSLWRAGPDTLFGERRAKDVGDLLTVLIEIDEKAELANKTDDNRTSDVSFGAPNLFGLESVIKDALPGHPTTDTLAKLSGSGKNSGDAAIKRSEKITLKIAATVTDILPNGNMVIRGSQEIRVNSELRDLQISGVVRTRDISRNNTVSYDKIGEARISYGGRGQLTAVQSPGAGGRMLRSLLPF